MYRPLPFLSCSQNKLLILVFCLGIWGPLQLSAQDTLNVFFETNSASIDSKERQRLDKWLDLMIIQQEDSFAIYGYTDDRGSAAYNRQLAFDRALAVRTFLVNYAGIRPEAITRIEGQGESVPLASNETEAGRSINRRVSILHFSYEMKMAIRSYKAKGQARGVDLDQVREEMKRAEEAKETSLEEAQSSSLDLIDLNVDKPEVDCMEESRILTSAHGVEVELGPCCLDKVGPDVELRVTPVFTRKEMLIHDVPTMDIDGDCLETDGVVKIELLNSFGKPVELVDSCLKLRMPAARQDAQKWIYYAIYGQDSSGFAWQSTYQTPHFKVDGNERGFYEVKLDVSRSVAIQKMVPDSRKRRHDPKIWIDVSPYDQENCQVYLSSKDVVLSGVWRKKDECYFRQGCISDLEAFLTVIAETDEGGYAVAHMPLKEVRYKGREDNGKYLVRKEDFVEVPNKEAMAAVINF